MKSTTSTTPSAPAAVVRFDQPSDAGRTWVMVSPTDPTLRVPADGRHHVGGLVVSYRDATGPAEATWVDDVDFRRHS
jgi:hypothetical protein